MERQLLREAVLHEKRRQELDELKKQRKERSKTSSSANFSGKQKKQQLQARKQRLHERAETAALFETNEEYEEFFMETKDNMMEKEFMIGPDEAKYHEVPDFYTRNHDLCDDSLSSRLKLTVALGRHNKDTVGKDLSSFFVKESREQIHLRLMEGQLPLDISGHNIPLLACELVRDPLLDHPRRPKWEYKMSKHTVDDNECVMFDAWLTAIHNKYKNEELNHFEHNLEVWRELWRVTERATHIVIVADIRNPLLHIPPSIYDMVVKEMNKPMIIVLNKMDLVPSTVVQLWLVYLKKRFAKCTFVCFSSRSMAVNGSTDISQRRRILTKKLAVGDPSAVRGAIEILISCGVDAHEAERVALELNTDNTTPELLDLGAEVARMNVETNKVATKRKSRRRQKGDISNAQAVADALKSTHVELCQHCGSDDAVWSCLSCRGCTLATVKSEEDALERGYLLCRRCDREEHVDLHNHEKYKLTARRLSSKQQSQVNPQNAATITIGLIGHPNVGKSSVLNALAGRKLVSVSHTPGHTKRLQSIMITPDICICDCPGLVFPFANVPKYLQELCGLYPFSQIREPYSAVRFLAQHMDLAQVLDVKPRTQLFDGEEEVLEWTPWSLCEAFAEKKGYRTDRRGRPDHQRAGAELIKETVDGIIPLFFFPPTYQGERLDLEVEQCSEQECESDERSDEEEGVEEKLEPVARNDCDAIKEQGFIKKTLNGFSLLDSSDDETSEEE